MIKEEENKKEEKTWRLFSNTISLILVFFLLGLLLYFTFDMENKFIYWLRIIIMVAAGLNVFFFFILNVKMFYPIIKKREERKGGKKRQVQNIEKLTCDNQNLKKEITNINSENQKLTQNIIQKNNENQKFRQEINQRAHNEAERKKQEIDSLVSLKNKIQQELNIIRQNKGDWNAIQKILSQTMDTFINERKN